MPFWFSFHKGDAFAFGGGQGEDVRADVLFETFYYHFEVVSVAFRWNPPLCAVKVPDLLHCPKSVDVNNCDNVVEVQGLDESEGFFAASFLELSVSNQAINSSGRSSKFFRKSDANR